MRSSAAKTPKEPQPKVEKEKQQTVGEILNKHNELTLKIAFLESVLEMCKENFCYHDGLEPKNLILTQDGRKVPAYVIDKLVADIEQQLLTPCQKEISTLTSIKVVK